MAAKNYLTYGILLIILTTIFATFTAIYSGGFNVVILRCFGGFWLIGLLLLVWGLVKFFTRKTIGVPDLILSKEPLQLGDRFTLNYRHQFPQKITIEHFTIRLIFRETATSGSGTSEETAVHEKIIADYQISGGDFRAGHPISESYNMQIPVDAMHTFQVFRNRIQWIIRVEANIPNLPNFIEEKEIVVLPKVIRS